MTPLGTIAWTLKFQAVLESDPMLTCHFCGRDGACEYEAMYRVWGTRRWVGAHLACLEKVVP